MGGTVRRRRGDARSVAAIEQAPGLSMIRSATRERLMKTRAAVALEAKKPLEIVELDLEGPRQGEGLIEVKATGICHTDYYTLSGADPEGLFPAVLGHEGAGVVLECGP